MTLSDLRLGISKHPHLQRSIEMVTQDELLKLHHFLPRQAGWFYQKKKKKKRSQDSRHQIFDQNEHGRLGASTSSVHEEHHRILLHKGAGLVVSVMVDDDGYRGARRGE